MKNKITFNSNRSYNNELTYPKPAKKSIPSWFSNASKYWKEQDGSDALDGNGKRGPGFKACPALSDIFTSGYFLTTPCDVNVFKYNGVPYARASEGFEDFCDIRPHMGEFHYPQGYYPYAYHWYPNWGFTLPDGYSALVMQPLNHFELPFLTTAGIIDSDKYPAPGLMPFFIKDGFEGIIPKGTPYVQIFPFKREEWGSEFNLYTEEEMIKRHEDHTKIYRTEEGGVYKRHTWIPKKFE